MVTTRRVQEGGERSSRTRYSFVRRLPRASVAGTLFARVSSKQELSCNKWDCIERARFSRVPQPLWCAIAESKMVSRGDFPLPLPFRISAGISLVLFSRSRCPSLIRHSYIRTIAKRSTASRKTGIRNRPSRGPIESERSLPRSPSPATSEAVFISPGIPRWLGAFRPLTLLSAPREGEGSSLGPVAAGAIEIRMCRRQEIYHDSIILFRRKTRRGRCSFTIALFVHLTWRL